jgi:hypothetical protein
LPAAVCSDTGFALSPSTVLREGFDKLRTRLSMLA